MNAAPLTYFDFNATTPLDPGIREVFVDALDTWGNPSSVHSLGRHARAVLDDARDRVARRMGCRPSEIVFTAGGTEANNLAVLGTARARRDRGRHLICSPTEHPAVLHCHRELERNEGFSVTWLPVDREGRVDPETVERAIRTDTVLVSVMAANNETGTLQPVAAIGRLCRQRGVLFHCDAVQWFGKEPTLNVDRFEADLVTFCAHKLHGPRGAGFLYARSPLPLAPHLIGGSQENDRRAGTENLPAILALTAVVERFLDPPVFPPGSLMPLTRRIERCLQDLPGVHGVSPTTERLANTIAFTVEGTDSMALLANLDLHGVCASSGSACSAGSVEPSHVLLAQGYDPLAASALVRFSLGRTSNSNDVERVLGFLPGVLARARQV